MNDIKILKLKTTEDVICFYEKRENTIKMTNPLSVYIEYNVKTNSQNLVMNYWLPINLIKEQSVEIESSEILTTMEPKEEFKEYYLNFINKLDKKLVNEVTKDELNLLLEKLDAKHLNQIH